MLKQTYTYDAIVIGSGISGGWAAKELCEKGLKTLVLERGNSISHGDYPTAMMDTWDFPHRGKLTPEEKKQYHVQSRTGFIREANKHHYVNDLENPYDEEESFDWIRGYHTGGRSLMWGRQCYRWSDLDFEANLKEGIAVDWPIRYKDLAPWYDYVERFAGISGQKMGLDHLPDSQFLPPMEMNCVEKEVKKSIESQFKGRYMTIGRTAHLTQPHNGRGKCQFRNRCDRGCPYGAYFSSQSTTLPAAQATGNLTIRHDSIVSAIIYDDQNQRASGVRVIDAQTEEVIEFKARIIFCNASTLGSTFILLNSVSSRFPNGLGNDSDQLGRNLMDHHYNVGAGGDFNGLEDKHYKGTRPNGIYIPRFRNIDKASHRDDYIRGFGYQGGARRTGWNRGIRSAAFGAEFKDALLKPGPWQMYLVGFGECLPYEDNRVKLNKDKQDKWGQPVLSINATFRENEVKMRKDMAQSAAEMLEASGLKNVHSWNDLHAVGKCIHEMGTARMGNDPKTSVLNKFGQMHAVPNVFVTDGACMTSSACQNPSLTYMALTARAAHYAVNEMKKLTI
ncbi:GMC family oxidoreductase [Fulvivirga sp. M361]|uniref:GMC oxidoreductase n=1 Tax=Fulvivirga sp. M361 TaxID=2594266 RepID=UPI00117ADBBE|nr:GMC family oxidoreductase [Fulvivirga sp. M361]TRX46391.1 GMC family oxidoreductase [Fulvivirga sp. M361]